MAQRPAVRYDEADSSRLNEYFIDQDGISREVIQADICRYLGRDALVRPGTHQVRLPPIQTNLENASLPLMVRGTKRKNLKLTFQNHRVALDISFVRIAI